MKIAYIISAYKYPQSVIRLVNKLNEPNNSFFVHIDKRADEQVYEKIFNELKHYSNVYFVKRYACFYMGFGLIEATLECLREALHKDNSFDYFINLSGQDYPIKTNSQIAEKLNLDKKSSYLWNFPLSFEGKVTNKGYISQRLTRIEYWHIRRGNWYFRFPYKNYRGKGISTAIRRFPLWLISKFFIPEKREFLKNFVPYGGGSWWCLSRKHVEYIDGFIKKNPKFYSFFRYTNIPDEIFFHTLLMNSPFKDQVVNNDLRLVIFEKNKTNPVIFTSKDYAKIIKSDAIFARKFDAAEDETILDMIDNYLDSSSACSQQQQRHKKV